MRWTRRKRWKVGGDGSVLVPSTQFTLRDHSNRRTRRVGVGGAPENWMTFLNDGCLARPMLHPSHDRGTRSHLPFTPPYPREFAFTGYRRAELYIIIFTHANLWRCAWSWRRRCLRGCPEVVGVRSRALIRMVCKSRVVFFLGCSNMCIIDSQKWCS